MELMHLWTSHRHQKPFLLITFLITGLLTANVANAYSLTKTTDDLIKDLIFIHGQWVPSTAQSQDWDPDLGTDPDSDPKEPNPPISEDRYPFNATSTSMFGEEVEADQDFRVWDRNRLLAWIWDDWINEYGAGFDPYYDEYLYEHLLVQEEYTPPKESDPWSNEVEFQYLQEVKKLNLIEQLKEIGILGPVNSLDEFYAIAYWSAKKQTIEQWDKTNTEGGFERFMAYSSYDSPLGKIPTEEYIGEWYKRITYASKNLTPEGSHTFDPTQGETKKLWASVNIMLQEANPEAASAHLAVMHMGYAGFQENIQNTYENIDWSHIELDRFAALDLPRLRGPNWGEPPTFEGTNLSEAQRQILLEKWGFTD
jgi:hypothetical protein